VHIYKSYPHRNPFERGRPMNKFVSKRLRRFAEETTEGHPKEIFKHVYKQLKKDYLAGKIGVYDDGVYVKGEKKWIIKKSSS
jgi:hypothetical protein